MAALNLPLFAYAATPAWPRNYRWRLLIYLALTIGAWQFPPWGALAAGALTIILGNRLAWWRWLANLGWFWLFTLAPLLNAAAESLFSGKLIFINWAEAGYKSLAFLVLLAASQWMSQSTSIFEIRSAFLVLFRVFGKRAAALLSLIAGLALSFMPWVAAQILAIREAGSLRGLPRRRPVLALRSLAVPLGVRLVEKARHTAEALELRGG